MAHHHRFHHLLQDLYVPRERSHRIKDRLGNEQAERARVLRKRRHAEEIAEHRRELRKVRALASVPSPLLHNTGCLRMRFVEIVVVADIVVVLVGGIVLFGVRKVKLRDRVFGIRHLAQCAEIESKQRRCQRASLRSEFRKGETSEDSSQVGVPVTAHLRSTLRELVNVA